MEDIEIGSGYSSPYSWLSTTSKEESPRNTLQFCLHSLDNESPSSLSLDHAEVDGEESSKDASKWSAPVSIDKEGITTCLIEHTGFVSEFIVEVVLIGALQYQVL